MPSYYTTTDSNGSLIVIRLGDGHMVSFAENPDNADWRAYQEWVAEGNTPEPWPPAE